MKRILVLDGGGAKGIMIAMVLFLLEKTLGQSLYKFFDLIVGTSVGGIIGGCIASGKMSAEEINNILSEAIFKIFSVENFWIPFLTPKYSTREFDIFFNKYIDKNLKMKDCYTNFMCTSVNKIDSKTHYFKSWENKDGELYLLDTIKRTYAAPYYFSSIKENGNIWMDGGMGNANCPLIQSIVEISRQNWLEKEPIIILSIGAGYSKKTKTFKEACKGGQISDILFYMNPLEGGLAKLQSVELQVELAKTFQNIFPNFSIQRLDRVISSEMNKIDKPEFIEEYKQFGIEMFNTINIELLKNGR